jgi:hypothetical protein
MVYMDEIDIQNIGEVVAIVLAKAVKANKITGSQWWELVLLFAAEIDEMKKINEMANE